MSYVEIASANEPKVPIIIKYGDKVLEVQQGETVEIDGLDFSAEGLQTITRPVYRPNIWCQFKRVRNEGFDKDSLHVIVTTLAVPA